MIEVKKLSKKFGAVQAVNDLSFSVVRGEILGLLGPNGAGKTTTLRILTGILPPTEGSAEVAGFDLARNPIEVRKRIGYLPEHVALYPELTVWEYLQFVASVWNFSKTERNRNIDEALSACGLSDVDQRLIGRLSRGFRQRLGLAQALIHDPEVLILDEPTVGLDPKQIREIRDLIKSFKGKKTIVLSTHILPEVSMTCDTVIILDQGKIVAKGTPESLGRSPDAQAQIKIEVRAPKEALLETLRTLPGIGRVDILEEKPENILVLLVSVREGGDLRPQIARILAAKNWDLFQLRSHTLSLEDIFLKLVTTEETP